MEPLVIRKSRVFAAQALALGTVLGTAGILAIVQGHRWGLGGGILLVTELLAAMGIGILRDREPWLMVDANGVHHRGPRGRMLQTIPWTSIVDARPEFSRGRPTGVRIEVAVPAPFTPRPSWWQRLMRREPDTVYSRPVHIDLSSTGASGVRVAQAILARQSAWEQSTVQELRHFRHLVRGDFA